MLIGQFQRDASKESVPEGTSRRGDRSERVVGAHLASARGSDARARVTDYSMLNPIRGIEWGSHQRMRSREVASEDVAELFEG